jgi:chemotaxis signal transduction protein
MNASTNTSLNFTTSTHSAEALAARLKRDHIVFEVDGLLYAVALADFDAVAEAGFTPQPVPDLPAWRGVLEDAEGLVAVLALHRIFAADFPTTSAINPGEQRLLLFRWEDLRCALHVDRCLGVFPIESAIRLALTRSPLLRVAHSGCRSVVKWNGHLVVVLNPGALISAALAVQLRGQLTKLGAKRKTAKQGKAAALEGTSPANAPLWEGALAGDTLAQVMQVLWLKKLTGELALESAGHTTFLIWENGHVIHARNGATLPPDNILNAALKSRHDRFCFRSGPVAGISRTIRTATPSLIRDSVSVLATSIHES